MSSNYLMEQLQWFLRDDQILDTDLWREIYARDASYFNIKPMCVLRPSTTEQVQQIMQLAHETGTSITFRAGGTSLCDKMAKRYGLNRVLQPIRSTASLPHTTLI